MSKELSLGELNKIVEKVFKDNWYPEELPNGMWEIAKGVFTNKRIREIL